MSAATGMQPARPGDDAQPVRILLVEDQPADAELTLAELHRSRMDAQVDIVSSPEEFSSRLSSKKYDVIIADYRLPGWTALDALALRDQLGCDIPFILATGTLGEDVAVQCIKLGVADYVLKDKLSRLPVAIMSALKEKTLRAERAKAERALRESEASFRLLFADNPLPMFVFDRESLALLEVNEATIREYGYMREELLSMKFTEIRPEGDIPRLLNFLAGFTGTLVDAGIWHHRGKNGRIFSVQAMFHAFEFSGRPAGLVVAQDVTEKLSLERQLRQAQKFEAFGQLAGGIAHDFNNMTGAILGWAELGIEKAVPESEFASYFEKIKKQAVRAASLTRQLLAFARRQVLQPRHIDVNQVVVEVLSLLEKVIGSNIEIQRRLSPDPMTVLADPAQIEQVVMNLCINSRDAMPEGGTLVVETSKCKLDDETALHLGRSSAGDFILLSVSDTGTGMDAATLERIFEPFFTTKEIGKGTGLGLATVYGIVHQHGGHITAKSVPGKGSTFLVFLPVANADPEIQYVKSKDAFARRGTETILLAEDHEGLREIARQCLERLGYRVLAATDGEEALHLFESNREDIALVFLDVVLPKISGPQAFAQMVKVKPGIRALFTTGYSEELADFGKGLPAGAMVLTKPYSSRDLAIKLREILDGEPSA